MIYSMLSHSGFNTLVYNNPDAKLHFVVSLILELYESKRIIYIDSDTSFTAYFRAGLFSSFKNMSYDNLKLYLPEEENISSTIISIIESIPDSSLVIFDSITSFSSLLYREINLENKLENKNVNHLLSILLMLLLKNTGYAKIPLLITNMIRHKHEEGWSKFLDKNRLLGLKSSVKLYANAKDENNLSISIGSHPNMKRQTITIPVTKLSII